MSHGTRKCYQAGCRLPSCKRAEANYRRHHRAELCRGRLPDGCRVNARATWRLINRLLKVGYKKHQIAAFLGLKQLPVRPDDEHVEHATAQRIAACYEALLAEGPELPCR